MDGRNDQLRLRPAREEGYPMRLGLTAVVFTCALALCACSSSHKTTIATSSGTTTIDTSSGTTAGSGSNSGSMTVTNKNGTMTMGANAVDTSKLGIPIYPGASTSGGGGGMSVQSKQGSGEMVSLTTNDSFGKVEGWYKSQLPTGSEQMNFTTGSTSSAVFQVGKETDADQKTISITSDGAKTTIQLTHKVSNGQ